MKTETEDLDSPSELIVVAELENALSTLPISPDGIQTLRAAFAPHFTEFHSLAVEASMVGKDQPKAARAMRLKLRAVRVAAEKTRKELKEDSLRRGKAIDGVNAVLEYQLVPVENAMDAIEKAEELAEAARVTALAGVRSEELRPYADPAFYELGKMPDDQWRNLLDGAKAAFAAKAEAARLAEEQRVEREKAQAAERERVRLENERLKAERLEQDRVLAKERAEHERQRKEAEEVARKERLRLQAVAEVERQKQAAERLAREKAEAEVRAREAEERRKVEVAAEERRRAAAAPDREKLRALAAAVRGLKFPDVGSREAAAIGTVFAEQREKFAAWIERKAAALVVEEEV